MSTGLQSRDRLSLYNQVVDADVAPTHAQLSAADGLFSEWNSISAASAKIWQDELVPLNVALKRARLPILRGNALATEDSDSSDEE
jgi:hypothetical protein